MMHKLKIRQAFYKAVLAGRKTFEIRFNDRGFNAGDLVVLCEVEDNMRETGPQKAFEIGYVTNFEQKEGWVVFSLLPINPDNEGAD